MGVSWKSNVLLGNESEGSEHGSASMFDFSFTEPLHVEVIREPDGVESNVSYVSCSVGGCLYKGYSLGHFCVECSDGGCRLCKVIDELGDDVSGSVDCIENNECGGYIYD